RFATTGEFAGALTRAATGSTTVATNIATPISGLRRTRRRVLYALLAGIAGIGLITSVRAVRLKHGGALAASEGSIRSLAVAPLENLTGDSAQTYLAQGVTDQLIANLAQIASLAVIKLPPRRGERTP